MSKNRHHRREVQKANWNWRFVHFLCGFRRSGRAFWGLLLLAVGGWWGAAIWAPNAGSAAGEGESNVGPQEFGQGFGGRGSVVAGEVDGVSRDGQAEGPTDGSVEISKAERAAETLCDAILGHLTWGPPLEAKLRLRAWAAGESVLAVGSYLQAGQGKGWMRMELQASIADGKGRWQQTCDGRLAWTREELGEEVHVRRVDLGRLRAPQLGQGTQQVPAWLRVGGLAELMDRIAADYRLRLSKGHIDQAEMWVLKGELRASEADALVEQAGGVFPALVPRLVRVAVPVEQVDRPLPARIEFWSESGGELLSLLEIYDTTTIEPPPVTQFRFEAGGDDFVNETDLYLRRFGMILAQRP